MISITRATEKDFESIVNIGNISVEEAHRDSCSAKDMKEYLEKNYNDNAIKEELNNSKYLYHTLNYNGKQVGFSKIVLNS